MIDRLEVLRLSPDGKECYGCKTPDNNEITHKINEIIDVINLLEVKIFDSFKEKESK